MELKEKIKVMQHFENGREVEYTFRDEDEWEILQNPSWDWRLFEYRILDKFSELKRAHSEGAIIEVKSLLKGEWFEFAGTPRWDVDISFYRIKGGIFIKEWDKHKEVIKAFWNGANIVFRPNKDTPWDETVTVTDTGPNWFDDFEYKVKERTNELTIKEIEKLTGLKNIKIVKG